jgi:hypothetical protein
MGLVRRLMESRPMTSRVPDQSLVTDVRSGSAHIRATRGQGYAFVYLPEGGIVEVNLASLNADQIHAWWYDPRTGNTRELGCFEPVGRQHFVAPYYGRGHDWVLVIDDARLNFPAPGISK